MIDRTSVYTSEFIKVSGLVSETIELLRLWSPGMSAAELRDAAIQSGTLTKDSAKRIEDIIYNGFSLRYLRDGQRPAQVLKYLIGRGVSIPLLRQLFSIYTARSNRLFMDVAGGYYWDLVSEGVRTISRENLETFIRSQLGTSKYSRAWSDLGTKIVARGLLKTLADFGYVSSNRSTNRMLTPPVILPETVGFLAYEARERGLSEPLLIEDRAFSLFGLNPSAVLKELLRLSGLYGLIVQASGDIIRISYQFATMEDFLNAITSGTIG